MKRIVFSNGVIVAAVCIILLMSVCTGYAFASGGNSGDPSSQLEEIEGYINKQMREGRIPGISVVVVKDNKTILKRVTDMRISRTKSRCLLILSLNWARQAKLLQR